MDARVGRWQSRLLECGTAMPAIYGLTLIAACMLNPGFDLIHREPSELGRATASYPMVYNVGMVATAIAGLLGAAGIMTCRTASGVSLWRVCLSVTLVLGSAGLAMAGIFPLPSPLHYGFGLTAAAALTPLFGAAAMWRLAHRLAAVLMIAGFALIIGLILAGVSPLLPGAIMFASVSYLCWRFRQRLDHQLNRTHAA